ncbi:TPA: hypothetical protein ACJHBQ_002500, partial [Escherichia coli]
ALCAGRICHFLLIPDGRIR